MVDVRIKLPLDRAKELSLGLSDLNCWARGYTCGLPSDDRAIYGPMGIHAAQDVNIILKGAISDTEEAQLSADELEAARLRRWLHQIEDFAAAVPDLRSIRVLRYAAQAALMGQPSPEGSKLAGFDHD